MLMVDLNKKRSIERDLKSDQMEEEMEENVELSRFYVLSFVLFTMKEGDSEYP